MDGVILFSFYLFFLPGLHLMGIALLQGKQNSPLGQMHWNFVGNKAFEVVSLFLSL